MKHSIDFYKAEANNRIEAAEVNILEKYVRHNTKRNNSKKIITKSIV
jgi:hypothetical protein